MFSELLKSDAAQKWQNVFSRLFIAVIVDLVYAIKEKENQQKETQTIRNVLMYFIPQIKKLDSTVCQAFLYCVFGHLIIGMS